MSGIGNLGSIGTFVDAASGAKKAPEMFRVELRLVAVLQGIMAETGQGRYARRMMR